MAVNLLHAFINEVNAQAGKHIEAEHAGPPGGTCPERHHGAGRLICTVRTADLRRGAGRFGLPRRARSNTLSKRLFFLLPVLLIGSLLLVACARRATEWQG